MTRTTAASSIIGMPPSAPRPGPAPAAPASPTRGPAPAPAWTFLGGASCRAPPEALLQNVNADEFAPGREQLGHNWSRLSVPDGHAVHPNNREKAEGARRQHGLVRVVKIEQCERRLVGLHPILFRQFSGGQEAHPGEVRAPR